MMTFDEIQRLDRALQNMREVVSEFSVEFGTLSEPDLLAEIEKATDAAADLELRAEAARTELQLRKIAKLVHHSET